MCISVVDTAYPSCISNIRLPMLCAGDSVCTNWVMSHLTESLSSNLARCDKSQPLLTPGWTWRDITGVRGANYVCKLFWWYCKLCRRESFISNLYWIFDCSASRPNLPRNVENSSRNGYQWHFGQIKCGWMDRQGWTCLLDVWSEAARTCDSSDCLVEHLPSISN